jgi:hypothetical protein
MSEKGTISNAFIFLRLKARDNDVCLHFLYVLESAFKG